MMRSRSVRVKMLSLPTFKWKIGLGILVLTVTCALAAPGWSVDGWVAVDGDTLKAPDGRVVRIANIDAPEAAGKCKCADECRRAEAATAYVRASLSHAGVVTLLPYPRPVDRYGRTLAYVVVDGRDLGELLVAEGLARPWRGRREGWCQ